MLCSNCGANNVEGKAFCQVCGYQLSANYQQPYQPYQPSQQVYSPYPGQQYYTPQQRDFSAVELVKSCCRAPVFLVATILYSVSFMINLIEVLENKSSSVIDLLYGAIIEMAGYEVSYELIEVMNEIEGATSVMNYILLIPGLLIVVGLWVTFGSSSSRTPGQLSTAGLGLAKGGIITKLVFACISIVFIQVIMGVLVVAAAEMSGSSAYYSYSSASDGVLAVMIILWAVVAVVCVLTIVFYACMLKSIGAIRQTIKSNSVVGGVSMFVAVILFGLATLMLISEIATITRYSNAFDILISLIGVASYVMFGIAIIVCRSKMREAIASSNAVSY